MTSRWQHYVTYALGRGILSGLALLPTSWLHTLGRGAGRIAYHLLPRFRKIALNNLALSDLHLTEEQVIRTAQGAFANLMTTCFEYGRLAHLKEIQQAAFCENPEEAAALLEKDRGVIFFCGHQANWELLFLEGTSRMPGVAIGRPIANAPLYQWITSIRERYGGHLLSPKEAIKGGLRALRQGKFLGIVGDQGMPATGYRAPFLGREAYTSPLPALLSYRTGAPIVVATIRRAGTRCAIRYSPPIWPNTEAPSEEEIPRLMELLSAPFEEAIRNHPEEWLWQHNRWKQQASPLVRRRFRYDTLAVLLPADLTLCNTLFSQLETLRALYPEEWITLWHPEGYLPTSIFPGVHIRSYASFDELRPHRLAYKLLFNFTGCRKLSRWFSSGSAIEVFDLARLSRCAGVAAATDLATALRRTLQPSTRD